MEYFLLRDGCREDLCVWRSGGNLYVDSCIDVAVYGARIGAFCSLLQGFWIEEM